MIPLPSFDHESGRETSHWVMPSLVGLAFRRDRVPGMAPRWFAALVLVACSHPAPKQETRGRLRYVAGGTTGSSAASVDGETPERQVAGDEAHARPIDGKVIEKHEDGADLRFTIGLPPEVKEGDLTEAWTGIFLRDGSPVPGTEFKLLSIKPHAVSAKVSGQQLPSESVRLYEPYYPANLKR
jgi:hypothetical protein